MGPFVTSALIAGGASLLNSLLGSANQSSAQSFNSEEAEKQRNWQSGENVLNRDYVTRENKISRDWQSAESQRARDWEEQMYNLYNSPSAMMRQYKEANLNPYLGASGQTGQGIGTAAPLSGSPAQSSPSMVSGSPAQSPGFYHPNLASDFASVAGVNAQAANQRSQSALNYVRAAVEAYKEGGSKMFNKVVDAFAPYLDGSDPESSEAIKMLRSERYNIDMRSLNEDFMYNTSKDWTVREKQAQFENLTSHTKNLLFDLVLKGSQKQLNDEELKVYASQIARNFADAFNLKKQGEYYSISAEQMSIVNKMMDLQYQDLYADFYGNQGIRSFKYTPEYIQSQLGLFKGDQNVRGFRQQIEGRNADIESNRILRYMREVTNDIGNIFKVNIGASTNRTNFNNMTPQSGNQMFYSGDGYYMNNGVLMKGNW